MPGALTRLIAVLSISALAGCASTKSVFPQDAPTMRETYDRHFERLQGGARPTLDDSGLERPTLGHPNREHPRLEDGEAALAGYTRAAHREIEALFPRLPNPTLVMYVFPHLAGADGVGVPGYATSFAMYERVHYALPGEVAPRYRSMGAGAGGVPPAEPPPVAAPGVATPVRATDARPLARGTW
jgi:conjugative transfer region lipoprotein (TIGR03751 family)